MSNAEEGSRGVLRHIVLLKIPSSVSENSLQSVEDGLAQLAKNLPMIKAAEWGLNVSLEGKSKGFTHCFSIVFHDSDGLQQYLPHPDHRAFSKLLSTVVEDVLVFDYEVGG